MTRKLWKMKIKRYKTYIKERFFGMLQITYAVMSMKNIKKHIIS